VNLVQSIVLALLLTVQPGRSKGFGFVEMPDQTEGEAAVQAMNGKELEGRELKVNEARPREERPSRPRY